MKRISILLALLLCAMMVFSANAAETAPGETVTIPISVGASNAYTIKLYITFDANIFEYVGIASSIGLASYNSESARGVISMYNEYNPIPAGQVGTITLKVKDDVKSGTYSVSVVVKEAFDTNYEDADVSASAGSVTVVADCAHDTTKENVTKKADCENAGSKQIICADCGEVIGTETIDALGHDMSKWTETKAPTCEAKGEETSTCALCGKTETRDVDALDHKFGEWKETKAPACEVKGEETSTCALCGKTETRETAALGHDVGEWVETKAPTCTEKGEEKATCSRCGEFDTREVAALGHSFGKWTAEKEAACEEEGLEYRVCGQCGEREERAIKALGHNAVWKVVYPATREEEGLKQQICKRCEAVLAEQVLPILKTTYKTACTAGIRIAELAPLMDQYDAWKMVTPIDLSIEGTTRYPLVAGNVYEIGYVDVTVADGVVCADMVVEAKVTMYSAALVLLNDASEFKRFTANDYEHYEFPVSINLSDLPSDQMLMMVICQLTIDMAKPEPKYYNFNSAEHAVLLEQLNEIIK